MRTMTLFDLSDLIAAESSPEMPNHATVVPDTHTPAPHPEPETEP